MEIRSAFEIRDAVNQGKISRAEVAREFLQKIHEQNADLNAVLTVADDFGTNVDQGRLNGVPILVKDMICTADLKTTAASKILADFIPPYDATLVSRLRSEGAIILGKCNMDEFAMGSSNETSFFGTCRNPWNTSYVPGGSSGGSACAVAAGMGPLSIGTDTGGSIRQPASFCGVVGMKPTYGRVSRFGVIAYGSSLDQAGPLGRTIKEVALALEIMSGWDSRDGTSSSADVPAWSDSINPDISGKKIGVPREIHSLLDESVSKVFQETLKKIEKAGGTLVDVSIPLLPTSVAIYYIVAMCEASSNLSRYDGVRFGYRSQEGPEKLKLEDFYRKNRTEGFGDEVKKRIMLGAFALSSGYIDEYYLRAARLRRKLSNQLNDVLKTCDVLCLPTSSVPPFQIGEKIDDPVQMLNNDVLTTFANLTGIPAISVPAGWSQQGLPIGVQFCAKGLDEQSLFDFGQFLENHMDRTSPSEGRDV